MGPHYFITTNIWQTFPWDKLTVVDGRAFLAVEALYTQAKLNDGGVGLPCVGQKCMHTGECFNLFELPGTKTESEEGSVRETVSIELIGHGQPTCIVQVDMLGLPKPSRNLDENESYDQWHAASVASMGLLDGHIYFVNSIYDEVTRPGWTNQWEGQVEGLAVRRVSICLKRWEAHELADEPRMSLIVRLESDKQFRNILRDVCNCPRVVLSRLREMVSLSRVQEVDPACMRWLVRQPGITLAQKAGIRQQAMAITRHENADTPENRVVRDLLVRAIGACNQYLRENQRFSDHDRVLRVLSFRSQLRVFLRESGVSDVRRIVGRPVPNYVLQHDLRYKLLWEKYVLLLRQEMQQDDAWRWRHRVWSEYVMLSLASVIGKLDSASAFGCSDIMIRGEQIAGHFVDPATVLPPVSVSILDGQCVVDLVMLDRLDDYRCVFSSVAPLKDISPDCLLVRRECRSGNVVAIVAVWTMMHLHFNDDTVSGKAEDLRKIMSTKKLGKVAALLLFPSDSNCPTTAIASGNVRAISLPLSKKKSCEILTDEIVSGLKLGTCGAGYA